MHSRRQFLKLTGIALASSQIGLRFFPAGAAQDIIHGRALIAAPVYSRATSESQIVSRLWPDSVTPIIDLQAGWYRVADGFVQREELQPVAPYSPAAFHNPGQPFWAEVNAPAAPIRVFAAADAPLVTRIGHGGVALIADYLPDQQGGWYSVSDDAGNILGWSQAAYWQPVEAEGSSETINLVEIDLNNQQLTAWENGRVVLQAPCSTDISIRPGSYIIHARKPGGAYSRSDDGTTLHGVPWLTSFGLDFALGGAYWHNRFGERVPGMAVQVTPLIARWLYGWLNDTSEIRVI